ncbi:hypothetical protein M3Y94_00228600 [Aphelenchoides besseyi]|nr:hypothetical protein M3Y94_00228600 [Aphelenchoides besseyi]
MMNVPPNVGFVFTSEMANQAVHDVQQGKQPTVAHWHSAHQNNTDPIRSLEQMATQSEIPTKSNKPDAGNASREQKFAILEHIKKQLNYLTPQPPPRAYNFRYSGPQMIPRPNGMYNSQPST